jgi:hypothetical protein
MNGIHVSNLSSADDSADLQIALTTRAWSDANSLVSEVNVHGVDVSLRINSNCFDIEFFAGSDDADGDFTTVSDENFFKHGTSD